jgi:hypothetical protein
MGAAAKVVSRILTGKADGKLERVIGWRNLLKIRRLVCGLKEAFCDLGMIGGGYVLTVAP